MKSVTIDNIGVQAHRRYAKDKAELDPTFLTEPLLLVPHVPSNSLSAIYSSKWEELFDLKGNSSWANFSPPPEFHLASSRLFRFDTFRPFWDTDAESSFESTKTLISSEWEDHPTINSLLDAIEKIQALLFLVHSRKLQYQKG